ncbi:MAG: hypothetical protein JXA52_01240 [Planctomycetes bacterium]|nr:hypothetical protein [Planctomycetota bacterium]
MEAKQSTPKFIIYPLCFCIAVLIFIALQFILPGRGERNVCCKVCGAKKIIYRWPLLPSYESDYEVTPLDKWMTAHYLRHSHDWVLTGSFGVRGYFGTNMECGDGGFPMACFMPKIQEEYLQQTPEPEIMALVKLLTSLNAVEKEQGEKEIEKLMEYYFSHQGTFPPSPPPGKATP